MRVLVGVDNAGPGKGPMSVCPWAQMVLSLFPLSLEAPRLGPSLGPQGRDLGQVSPGPHTQLMLSGHIGCNQPPAQPNLGKVPPCQESRQHYDCLSAFPAHTLPHKDALPNSSRLWFV